jgi:hypothetical protein
MAIREQAKAITGGVVAGLTALGTALADGSVSQLEWTLVALAAVVAYGAVFGVRQPASLASLPALSSDELLGLAERAARRDDR